MVNPDLTILVVKVNRGEDLRWVGSRWSLTHALIDFKFRYKFAFQNFALFTAKLSRVT